MYRLCLLLIVSAFSNVIVVGCGDGNSDVGEDEGNSDNPQDSEDISSDTAEETETGDSASEAEPVTGGSFLMRYENYYYRDGEQRGSGCEFYPSGAIIRSSLKTPGQDYYVNESSCETSSEDVWRDLIIGAAYTYNISAAKGGLEYRIYSGEFVNNGEDLEMTFDFSSYLTDIHWSLVKDGVVVTADAKALGVSRFEFKKNYAGTGTSIVSVVAIKEDGTAVMNFIAGEYQLSAKLLDADENILASWAATDIFTVSRDTPLDVPPIEFVIAP